MEGLIWEIFRTAVSIVCAFLYFRSQSRLSKSVGERENLTFRNARLQDDLQRAREQMEEERRQYVRWSDGEYLAHMAEEVNTHTAPLKEVEDALPILRPKPELKRRIQTRNVRDKIFPG